MTLYLCLPLLVVLLQPALCLYNCSSEYNRTPGRLTITFTEPDCSVLYEHSAQIKAECICCDKHKLRNYFSSLLPCFFSSLSLQQQQLDHNINFPSGSNGRNLTILKHKSMLSFKSPRFLFVFFHRQFGPDSWLWSQYDHPENQPVHGSVGRLQHHRLGSERKPQHYGVPGLDRHQCGPSNHHLPTSCESQSE